jgi:hypothetical protein
VVSILGSLALGYLLPASELVFKKMTGAFSAERHDSTVYSLHESLDPWSIFDTSKCFCTPILVDSLTYSLMESRPSYVFVTGEKKLPGDEYTKESQLHGGEMPGSLDFLLLNTWFVYYCTQPSY